MKFNSQICTSRSQSERLLDLGLKADTADMRYILFEGDLEPCIRAMPWNSICIPCQNNFPAWSLHRLIEMMPYDFTYNNNTYELGITCDGAGYDDSEDGYPIVGWWRSNTYDDIIDCIEWLIKEGHFNKEYLAE